MFKGACVSCEVDELVDGAQVLGPEVSEEDLDEWRGWHQTICSNISEFINTPVALGHVAKDIPYQTSPLPLSVALCSSTGACGVAVAGLPLSHVRKRPPIFDR